MTQHSQMERIHSNIQGANVFVKAPNTHVVKAASGVVKYDHASMMKALSSVSTSSPLKKA